MSIVGECLVLILAINSFLALIGSVKTLLARSSDETKAEPKPEEVQN